MNRIFKKIIATACALVTTVAIMPFTVSAATVNANITVDGNADDWAGITAQTVNSSLSVNTPGVEAVKYAYSTDGSVLYICYTGISKNTWDSSCIGNVNLVITSDDTTTETQVSNYYYNSWLGVQVNYSNTAGGINTGDYVVELSVPVSNLGNNFSIAIDDTYNNITSSAISSSDIPTIDGNDSVSTESAVYSGITIDGRFSDWNAVSKTAASDSNPEHPDTISAVASVFDGDYLYIYIADGAGSTATGAGNHNNGMFCITSDLNRTMVFQLNNDGTVSGKDGITSVHHSDQWEIAIPKSALPRYQSSLSFGLYLSDPIITGITNMQTDEGTEGNVGSFNGIVYDGLFGDWEAYPHTLIQYATSGSNELLADGESAIYSENGILYGHVESAMKRHTSQYGIEMTKNIHIRFNSNDSTSFSARLIEVDSNGNINWDPDFTKMEDCQSHEYYIVGENAWGKSPNIDNILNDYDAICGKITINVGGDGQIDECEYTMDLEKLADNINLQIGTNTGTLGTYTADDFKFIEAQFGEIGNQWTSYSGTTTGPWVGIILCAITAVVPATVIRSKKRKAFKPALES